MGTFKAKDGNGRVVDFELSQDDASAVCWHLAEEQEGNEDLDLDEYEADWGGGVCPPNCDGNGWPTFEKE